MSRSGESVTRLDIRFPNEMYHKLQQIAVRDGARTHHISQKVEVSPTAIKLLQFALDIVAERLSDSSDSISDSLSAMATTISLDKAGYLSGKPSSALSDKDQSVSDISDKRIEGIVDKRLAELGLFPTSQSFQVSIDDSYLSDKNDTVPDTLSDSSVITSDKGALLLDNLPDTKNIPSDDSSNVESVAKDAQVIPTDAIEQVSREIVEWYFLNEFHDIIDTSVPVRKTKANRDIAIAIAKDKGLGDWEWNTQLKRFQLSKFTGSTNTN